MKLSDEMLSWEINYFAGADDKTFLPPVEIGGAQQKAFEKLVQAWNLIHEAGDIKSDISLQSRSFEVEKDALAFVVEAIMQEDPQLFQRTIDHLIERVKTYEQGKIQNHLSEIHLTFFELINLHYEKFLHQRFQFATAKEDNDLQKRIIQMAESHLSLSNSQKNLFIFTNQPIQVGGISRTTLPHWYHRDYISNTAENRFYLIHSP